MRLACVGMELEYCELREFTYGFFVHCSQVLGADFVEYVPAVLNFALHSCKSGDGALFYRDPDDEEGIDLSHHYPLLYRFFEIIYCFL